MNDTDALKGRDDDMAAGPATTPAQQRLQRDASVGDDDLPVYVTDDGYPTSLAHAPDVTNAGLDNNASVDGLGADLDAMPGDETPIRP